MWNRWASDGLGAGVEERGGVSGAGGIHYWTVVAVVVVVAVAAVVGDGGGGEGELLLRGELLIHLKDLHWILVTLPELLKE